MIEKILNSRLIIPAIVLLFAFALIWYLIYPSAQNLISSLPDMDNRPKSIGENDSVFIGEYFEKFIEFEQENTENWPRFRGSDFDNISKDKTPIAESWPTSGPPIAWQIDLGEGHAGPAIHNGKVYILDYIEKEKADALRVFSFKTGAEIWRRWYKVLIKRNHGMSRSIPTVTDDYVITFGPRCHVMCTDSDTGELLWTLDLIRDFGAELPQWYTAQCPLIDNNIAVIAIGGKNLAMGVDCSNGEIVWETPNPDNLKMSHSSVFTSSFYGKKTYVYMAVGGIVGISAEGEDIGRILWKSSEWNPTVVATSPVFLGNNEILVTTGYGAGGARIRILKTSTGFEAKLIEMHSPKEGLSSEQQTPILNNDILWTISPKDAGALRNELLAYHKNDLRNPLWKSGKENRYGLGPYLIVGDKMFLLNDESELYLFKIEKQKAQLLAQHKVFMDGVDAWGPMAYIDGYLILRDSHRMVSLYVGQ